MKLRIACLAGMVIAITGLLVVGTRDATAASAPPTCFNCYWTFRNGTLVGYGCEACAVCNGGTSCTNDGTTCNLSGSCHPTFNHRLLTPVGGVEAQGLEATKAVSSTAYRRLDCGIIAERHISPHTAQQIRSRTSTLRV